ncbi:MAG: RNA methyltransferase [Clostridia bacterium]|nr:RNA methyltransferase [Clostridia bacterium]
MIVSIIMILSKQNATVKEIRSLSYKKFRDTLGLYTVESVKLVKDAVSLKLPIKIIIGTEKGLAMLGETEYNTEVVSEEVYKSISEQVSPQGVLAVLYKPQTVAIEESESSILLDGVSDPANVGAIIRTAAASGYKTVYMTLDSADPYSPKAVRSAMGGIFRVNVVRNSIENLLDCIKNPITVADMNGKNVFEQGIEGGLCLVIGNEGKGVSDVIKKRAKYTVSIPMENSVESLNAAVSAGILMYNLKRK